MSICFTEQHIAFLKSCPKNAWRASNGVGFNTANYNTTRIRFHTDLEDGIFLSVASRLAGQSIPLLFESNWYKSPYTFGQVQEALEEMNTACK